MIFAIRYASGTATWLTYLALVAVPMLAAIALGWVARGARPPLRDRRRAGCSCSSGASPHSLAGEAAEAILSALSCVTLGVLLGAVTPPGWLKAGIIAMACADVWLVASDLLQHPNTVLDAAAPGRRAAAAAERAVRLGHDGLRRPVRGGAAGRDLRARTAGCSWPAALLTFVFACAFDLLFFVVNELPATVPVALAMIVLQLRPAARGQPARDRLQAARATLLVLRARPVEAGGRDSSASEVIASVPCAASTSTSVASSAERAYSSTSRCTTIRSSSCLWKRTWVKNSLVP